MKEFQKIDIIVLNAGMSPSFRRWSGELVLCAKVEYFDVFPR